MKNSMEGISNKNEFFEEEFLNIKNKVSEFKSETTWLKKVVEVLLQYNTINNLIITNVPIQENGGSGEDASIPSIGDSRL